MVSPLELIEKNPEPPEPIVDLLFKKKGVTIISGTDGVGKTWFGLQLAVCIASGRDIIDLKVSQRPVLMVQFELSNAQLSSRLQKYGTLLVQMGTSTYQTYQIKTSSLQMLGTRLLIHYMKKTSQMV